MGHRSGRTWKIFKTTIALMSFASATLANGRFPRGQRLIESATDKNLLALYGTYGLMVSSDAGKSWSHVCEAATGKYAGEDPLLEILPDGKIVARTDTALIRSAGSWCDWTSIRSSSGASAVQDITRTEANPLTILALVGSFVQGSGFSSQFIQSTDGGTTWSKEKALPLVARGLSLDVAPSNAKRVVVSGLDSANGGRLLVSDDGGGTWLGRVITGTDSNSIPYLAAISKNDPSRIFVRTDSYQPINGIDTAQDALLVSVDGGTSWSTLIQRSAKLFGFALSPDESTLLVGYGDPIFSGTYVEPLDLGIYRADMAAVLSDLPNASAHFEKIFEASVTCLRWTTTGLFACTSQDEVGFEVGRAPDASFALADANPFTPLLRLPDVRPLPCSAGTNGYVCYTDPDNGFASVCRVFKTSCDASAPPPSDNPDSSAIPPSSGGVTGGFSGGSGGLPAGDGGGAPPQGGGRDRGGAGGGSAGSAAPAGESSCACRSASRRSSNAVGMLCVAALGVVFGMRRRRVNTGS